MTACRRPESLGLAFKNLRFAFTKGHSGVPRNAPQHAIEGGGVGGSEFEPSQKVEGFFAVPLLHARPPWALGRTLNAVLLKKGQRQNLSQFQ